MSGYNPSPKPNLNNQLRFPEFKKITSNHTYLLKELVTIHQGASTTNDFNSKGQYYVISGAKQPSGRYHQANVPAHTITISRSYSCGHVLYHDEPFWCTVYAYFLNNVDTTKVNYKFLYYLLKYHQPRLEQMQTGISIKNIYFRNIQKFVLNLKWDLAEQTKIAHFLTLLDERIKFQTQIVAALKLKKTYFFKQLMTQKLRFPEFKKITFDHTYLLKELVTIQKGQQLNETTFTAAGKYYVMNGGMRPSGRYHQTNTPAHTITISSHYCGGHVFYHEEPFWCGGNTYFLNNIDPTKFNYKFLYYLLKYHQSRLQKMQTGISIKSISLPNIQKFRLNLKWDLPEQTKISHFLTLLDEKITLHTDLLADYHHQQTYFLHQMLK